MRKGCCKASAAVARVAGLRSKRVFSKSIAEPNSSGAKQLFSLFKVFFARFLGDSVGERSFWQSSFRSRGGEDGLQMRFFPETEKNIHKNHGKCIIHTTSIHTKSSSVMWINFKNIIYLHGWIA